MKQKDLMQPSILQQNLFFDNLPEQDITQYQLKKPSQKTSLIPQEDVKSKPKKQRDSQQISSFMNKIKKESLTVKLQIGNVCLDNSDDLNHDENRQKFLSDEISSKKNQNNQGVVQGQIHTESFWDIIEFKLQRPQGKQIRQKQPKIQQNCTNLEREEQDKNIPKPIVEKAQNHFESKSGVQIVSEAPQQQKRKSINLCLSLEDSESDNQQIQTSKQKSQKVETIKPQQKNKFKKITYLNRKSTNTSQNTVPIEQTKVHPKNFQQQQKEKVQGSQTKESTKESQILSHIITNQQKKNSQRKSTQKPLLLMTFDSQEDNASQDNQSSSSSEFETTIQLPQSIKNSHKPLQPNCQTKKPKKLLPNSDKPNNNQNKILLNNFDDQSSSDSSECVANNNPILLKTSSIDSSNSISSNEQQINLTRPINILQFSRMTTTSLTYVYQPIPLNCIFQSVVKRYQEPNQNNLVYEMFDHMTYKSILKVRHVSEGFQFFSSKESLNVPWNGNSKSLPQLNEETSCALLSSNFFGTQFNCFRFNRNNEKPDMAKLNRLITINYETNLFGLNGPRRMQVYIPGANYLIRGEKNLQQAFESEKKINPNEPSKIDHFVNRKPKWNNQITSFVLNFNGRATVSSVKNFIITRPKEGTNGKESQENLVLFGKIEKNMFNLDIRHPFNLVQGLALALSSFDKKIACE